MEAAFGGEEKDEVKGDDVGGDDESDEEDGDEGDEELGVPKKAVAERKTSTPALACYKVTVDLATAYAPEMLSQFAAHSSLPVILRGDGRNTYRCSTSSCLSSFWRGLF